MLCKKFSLESVHGKTDFPVRRNGFHSFKLLLVPLQQLWFCWLQEPVSKEPTLSNVLLFPLSTWKVEAIALLRKGLLI